MTAACRVTRRDCHLSFLLPSILPPSWSQAPAGRGSEPGDPLQERVDSDCSLASTPLAQLMGQRRVHGSWGHRAPHPMPDRQPQPWLTPRPGRRTRSSRLQQRRGCGGLVCVTLWLGGSWRSHWAQRAPVLAPRPSSRSQSRRRLWDPPIPPEAEVALKPNFRSHSTGVPTEGPRKGSWVVRSPQTLLGRRSQSPSAVN